jgi:eukaryotic-like serine/threonine-protein kinase
VPAPDSVSLADAIPLEHGPSKAEQQMKQSTWNPVRWQRVTMHFQRALDLPMEQRQAFIDRLHDDDPDVSVVVERMLAADAAFSTDTPSSAVPIMTRITDPVLSAGAQLGAYSVETCLGAGGMGRVYRARRTAGDVAQTVAIKCLRFPHRDADFMRRFLRERRILASLAHPNIARFFDAGTLDDGQPFVVLEFIDGKPITEYAQERRLGIRERIELLLKVISAVTYLHRQLIVHRDIKPSNVLVTANGEPFLLDFGIAKSFATDEGLVPEDDETAFEQRAFSLAHAAPEQISGRPVGIASDIYSLGVMAYELLCAAPPFAFTGLTFADAQHIVLEQLPQAPSERIPNHGTAPDGSDGSAWKSSLRGDLDNIVQHALKKEAESRYPSAEAFGDDLRRFLDSRPISLRGGQRLYRAQRFVRRNRVAVGLAASLTLALVAGGAMLWRQYLATELERDTALVERRKAEALSGLLMNAFEAADPSRNRGADVSAREILDQAARRVDSAGVDAATRTSLLVTISDVYRTLGLHKDSGVLAEAAIGRSQDVPPLLRARAWRALAQAQLGMGDSAAASESLSAAKTELPTELDTDTVVEAIERESVAIEILIARGLAPEALGRFKALYDRAKKALGPAHPLTIRCGVYYAERLRVLRKTEASRVMLNELLQSFPDPDHDPIGVRLLGDLARCELALFQIDSADAYAERHAKGVRLLYGEQHRRYVSVLDVLAKIAAAKEDYERAIALNRQALSVSEKITAKRGSSSMAIVLNNLAGNLRLAGRSEESLETASAAVEMATRVLPEGHNNIAHFRIMMAEALIELRRFPEALVQLNKSETIFAATLTPETPGVARAHGEVLRAESLWGLRRTIEAESAFARGWARIQQLPAEDPIKTHALNLRARFTGANAQ